MSEKLPKKSRFTIVKLTVFHCWNCEKLFDPYDVQEGGETITENRFCSHECYNEWMCENREEFN